MSRSPAKPLRTTASRAPVSVLAVGAGGIEELHDQLDDSMVCWALLRFQVGSGSFARTKMVAVHFNGDSVQAMKRGQLNARSKDVLEELGKVHATIVLETKEDVQVGTLCERLLPFFVDDSGVEGGSSAESLRKAYEAAIASRRRRSRTLSSIRSSESLTAKEKGGTPITTDQAVRAVAAKSGPYNWVLLEPTALEMHNAGYGGLLEMKTWLAEDKVLFGAVRFTFGWIEGSKIVKHIFLHWVGPKTSTVKRGKWNSKKNDAVRKVGKECVLALQKSAHHVEDVELEDMIKELRRLTILDGMTSEGGESAEAISVEEYLKALERERDEQMLLEAEFGIEDAAPPLPTVKTAVSTVRTEGGGWNWALLGFESATPSGGSPATDAKAEEAAAEKAAEEKAAAEKAAAEKAAAEKAAAEEAAAEKAAAEKAAAEKAAAEKASMEKSAAEKAAAEKAAADKAAPENAATEEVDQKTAGQDAAKKPEEAAESTKAEHSAEREVVDGAQGWFDGVQSWFGGSGDKAAAQTEDERKAAAEERKVQEAAEEERKAREEDERKAQEAAENERKEREAAEEKERKARETAENERKAREAAAEEEARRAQEAVEEARVQEAADKAREAARKRAQSTTSSRGSTASFSSLRKPSAKDRKQSSKSVSFAMDLDGSRRKSSSLSVFHRPSRTSRASTATLQDEQVEAGTKNDNSGAWAIEIDRAAGGDLGLDLDYMTLRIKSLREGLVFQWNQANPSLAVVAGDMILEVNGKTGAGVLSELVQRGLLTIKVGRDVQREHRVTFADFTLVADETVERMGWASSGLPPDGVLVSQIAPQSWGSRQGLRPGDEVHAVAGSLVKEMDHKDFLAAVKRRPLTLVFRRWVDCSASFASMAPTASAASTSGPVTVGAQGTAFTLTADESTGSLGWLSLGLPPDRVFVSEIDDNSWAAKSGMRFQDELIMLDEQPITQFTPDAFVQAVGRRPLRFTFIRHASPTAAQAAAMASVRPAMASNAPAHRPWGSVASTMAPTSSSAARASQAILPPNRHSHIVVTMPEWQDWAGELYLRAGWQWRRRYFQLSKCRLRWWASREDVVKEPMQEPMGQVALVTKACHWAVQKLQGSCFELVYEQAPQAQQAPPPIKRYQLQADDARIAREFAKNLYHHVRYVDMLDYWPMPLDGRQSDIRCYGIDYPS